MCGSGGPSHMAALSFFFFNDTATTEIYTLSLHDSLPIYGVAGFHCLLEQPFQRGQRAHYHENLVREQRSGNPDQRMIDADQESRQSSIAERHGERRRHAADFLDAISGLFEEVADRREGE